jgi:voltage-gated sodium channel
MQSWLSRFVESQSFRTAVMIAVGLNALVLGLDTYAGLPSSVQTCLTRLDNMFVMVFVCELILKLFAWRARFFTSAWNIFDLVVVAISLVAAGPFSVLRALRVLRTFRLVSAVPSMRRVVEALIRAVPGIGAILGIMALFFYVSAVMTTSAYGEEYPELFGALGTSTITLFQFMLFDNWADNIRTVGATHPMAPLYFIVFTVVSAFAVLNLFIAVMVDALRVEHDRLREVELETLEEGQKVARRGLEELEGSIRSLEAKVDTMLEKLETIRVPALRDGERQ